MPAAYAAGPASLTLNPHPHPNPNRNPNPNRHPNPNPNPLQAGPAPPIQPNPLALCTGMNPGYIPAPALSWQQAMGHPGVQAGYGEVPALLVANPHPHPSPNPNPTPNP